MHTQEDKKTAYYSISVQKIFGEVSMKFKTLSSGELSPCVPFLTMFQ